MEFRFNVNDIFKSSIVEIGPSLIPPGVSYADKRALWDAVNKVAEVVNAMGEASAVAQGLTKPITTSDRLRNSEQKVYLLIDGDGNNGQGAVTGMLKTGKKGLYVFDREGHHYQVQPSCVLDFYIHESKQRMGLGKQLFEHMLTEEKVEPVKLAIDRPSDKFLGFLNKHYALNNPVRQMNNFVVFDGFFPEPVGGSAKGDNSEVPTTKSNQAANGLQSSFSAPYGRYGAPRPPCSMGQIIHNQSPMSHQAQEPTGTSLNIRPAPKIRSNVAPSEYHKHQSRNVGSAVSQSTTNIQYNYQNQNQQGAQKAYEQQSYRQGTNVQQTRELPKNVVVQPYQENVMQNAQKHMQQQQQLQQKQQQQLLLDGHNLSEQQYVHQQDLYSQYQPLQRSNDEMLASGQQMLQQPIQQIPQYAQQQSQQPVQAAHQMSPEQSALQQYMQQIQQMQQPVHTQRQPSTQAQQLTHMPQFGQMQQPIQTQQSVPMQMHQPAQQKQFPQQVQMRYPPQQMYPAMQQPQQMLQEHLQSYIQQEQFRPTAQPSQAPAEVLQPAVQPLQANVQTPQSTAQYMQQQVPYRQQPQPVVQQVPQQQTATQQIYQNIAQVDKKKSVQFIPQYQHVPTAQSETQVAYQQAAQHQQQYVQPPYEGRAYRPSAQQYAQQQISQSKQAAAEQKQKIDATQLRLRQQADQKIHKLEQLMQQAQQPIQQIQQPIQQAQQPIQQVQRPIQQIQQPIKEISQPIQNLQQPIQQTQQPIQQVQQPIQQIQRSVQHLQQPIQQIQIPIQQIQQPIQQMQQPIQQAKQPIEQVQQVPLSNPMLQAIPQGYVSQPNMVTHEKRIPASEVQSDMQTVATYGSQQMRPSQPVQQHRTQVPPQYQSPPMAHEPSSLAQYAQAPRMEQPHVVAQNTQGGDSQAYQKVPNAMNGMPNAAGGDMQPIEAR